MLFLYTGIQSAAVTVSAGKKTYSNDDRPDDDRPYIIEKKSYQLIFHDKMSSNLSLNQATLKVEIMNNGKLVELPEKYYMVRTDLEGETFRVTVGLVAAFNDGQISYDQLKNAAQIVVSYDANGKRQCYQWRQGGEPCMGQRQRRGYR